MKYLILVGDGMGDLPLAELDGRTPLQAASTPNMDRLAREGVLGLTQTVPPGKEPGSDTANMSLLGYDPAIFHTGRSPIEAAAMGVDLAPGEIAFRCNLVTLDHTGGQTVMAEYAAGHIDSPTAARLIESLDRKLGREGLRFYPGVSYRHLLVWKDGPLKAATVPPHDRSGQSVDDVLNGGGGLELVTELTRASWPLLKDHPANAERVAQGKPPANSIWLWGQGTKPSFTTYRDRFGLGGVAISAVDLIKGLGVLAGLDPVEVEGATGWLDTNYAGKVAAALKGLEQGDVAYVHVEAPDEASHGGDLKLKMQAIEDFDRLAVGPLIQGLAGVGPHRVLLATDHFTPISTRTHGTQAVPYVLWDSENPRQNKAGFNEADAAQGVSEPQAHVLVERLVEGF
ncbi:MAG: cofactor-independent phosphoglycerate mutase [Desulfarculus sp.]|nr:cofactor-independent phosphoglycerate mutase [Pseudomonadota bacterium]MBV1714458.1 cofactor-independent phosphoglycerate mutase [Desulfarculus sp.]MBU4573090.1 cofactor-independent phosphoglycerate mutase [Pseudomonadota bacterium]MBU4599293.1 cofactor-independent phosphoglycerate mutase [Pseudomonadota bacterium]MBV1737174.1 cofactor-independent phosphoglycerate mutase [Desulfarculus sp.]